MSTTDSTKWDGKRTNCLRYGKGRVFYDVAANCAQSLHTTGFNAFTKALLGLTGYITLALLTLADKGFDLIGKFRTGNCEVNNGFTTAQNGISGFNNVVVSST